MLPVASVNAVLADLNPSGRVGTGAVPGATASSSAPSAVSNPSLSSGFGGFGGGLASSPNVPAPGSSIDPSTGLPHTAGITRAELEARKAASAGGAQSSGLMSGLGTAPNVPAPGSSIDATTGLPHTAGLTRAELDSIKTRGAGLLEGGSGDVHDLSGRQQAAAQLVGGGLGVPASPNPRKGSIVEVSIPF